MRLASRLTAAVVLCLACGTAGAAPRASGIAGRTVAGPICPVERVPPQPQCAPRPLAARVRIQRAGSSHALEVVRSGADGRFRVRLAPGVYILTPLRTSASGFPRPPGSRRVRVAAQRFTPVKIVYDTGIR